MITVLGDIHGDQRIVQRVLEKKKYVLQLGDLGFNYSYLDNIDPARFKFFGGNHDNYDHCYDYPHCLGDFGLRTLNDIEFFFVRGGFSIDWPWRVSRQEIDGLKIWWPEEQLSLKECDLCFKEFVRLKPQTVISHSVPTSISRQVGNPDVLTHFGYDPATFTTNTQELLQAMYEEGWVKTWLAGHLHKGYMIDDGRTKFVGLNISQTYDLEE